METGQSPNSCSATVKDSEGEHQMAQVDWYIDGVEFSNCNCEYATPDES